MGPAVSLIATSEEIAAIVCLGRDAEGVEDVSEPSALDASRALNAGITAEDVKTALEIVTLIFKSGAALLVFLTALRAEIRSRGGVVAVSDPVTGKPLGRIDARTADTALARLAQP
jgi:hypothetical protein